MRIRIVISQLIHNIAVVFILSLEAFEGDNTESRPAVVSVTNRSRTKLNIEVMGRSSNIKS